MTDRQGSVVLAVNGAGTGVVEAMSYDVFGNETTTGTVVTNRGYTGVMTDPETGMQYHSLGDGQQAGRDVRSDHGDVYHQGSGRVCGWAEQSLCLCRNDPTNFADWSGMQAGTILKEQTKAIQLLEKQVKQERLDKQVMAADLLEHFLANKGTDYVPNKDDIKDVDKQSDSMIRATLDLLIGENLIGKYLLTHPAETYTDSDRKIRWLSNESVAFGFQYWLADGNPKLTNESMFLAFGGAVLTTATQLRITGKEPFRYSFYGYQYPIVVARTKVTIADDYNSKKPPLVLDLFTRPSTRCALFCR